MQGESCDGGRIVRESETKVKRFAASHNQSELFRTPKLVYWPPFCAATQRAAPTSDR